MKRLTPEQCLEQVAKIVDKNIVNKKTYFANNFGRITLSDAISQARQELPHMSPFGQHDVLKKLLDVNDYIPSAVYGDPLKAIVDLRNEINTIMLSHYYEEKRSDFTAYEEIAESRLPESPGTVIVWCGEPMIISKVNGYYMETMTFNILPEKTEIFYEALRANLEGEPHYVIGRIPVENLPE